MSTSKPTPVTLRSALAAKIAAKSAGKGSEKNPKFYNQQKNDFAVDMTCHKEPKVRAAAFASTNCASNSLQAGLLIEKDKGALRSILMNDNLKVKYITEFMNDERVNQFADDKELEAHLINRVG